MRYNVDNVPVAIRPFWLAFSWLVALSFLVVAVILQSTYRIRIEKHADFDGQRNCIFCLWHKYWILWAMSFLLSHRGHAWMQHPAAYMKPIHIGLGILGIRVLSGSGGKGGRNAANDLACLLRQGWSTVLSPDGPYGPQGILKKGILHIALQSGVPIQPVRFIVPRTFEIPLWDKKLVPLPFSKITVLFEEPIIVSESNFDEVAQLLVDKMKGSRV